MLEIDLITKMIGGAATGYVTNNLALKMLFRKYGPFGGVILETRDEFIKNASALVERDIINHNTINNELHKEEFKKVFRDIVYDIFNNFLYKNIGSVKWEDIPDFNKSINNLDCFLGDYFQDYGREYIEIFSRHIYLKDILSNQQLKFTINQLINNFEEIILESNLVKHAMINFYQENKNTSLSYFVSGDVIKKIANNIIDNNQELHLILQNEYGDDIDHLINQLDIEELGEQLDSSINQKTIAELVGIQDQKNKFLKQVDGKIDE